ncbi:hypothetical protein KKD52_13190 [Myxococcota bacterium]|nr:hypothetical protein [Myxococcota bacterium]MBU1413205.1 hypothetical protein [Myxococcota bacterium]MBU1511309.1 hypothetical protein [Myxococcota bacterium]
MRIKLLNLGLSLVALFYLQACGKSEKSRARQAPVMVERTVETTMASPAAKPTRDATPTAEMSTTPAPRIDVSSEPAAIEEKAFLSVKPEENWKQVAELPEGDYTGAAFSPDGKWFAYPDKRNPEWVRVMDTATWKTSKIYQVQCRRLQFHANNGSLLCDNSLHYQFSDFGYDKPESKTAELSVIDLTTNKFVMKSSGDFQVLSIGKCEFADAANSWDCDAALVPPLFSDRFDKVVGITAFNDTPRLAVMPVAGGEIDNGSGGKDALHRLPMRRYARYETSFAKNDGVLLVKQDVGVDESSVTVFDVAKKTKLAEERGIKCTLGRSRFFACSNYEGIRLFSVDKKAPVFSMPYFVSGGNLIVRHISDDGARVLVSYKEFFSVTTDGRSVRKLDLSGLHFVSASPDGRVAIFSDNNRYQVFSDRSVPSVLKPGADPPVMDPGTGNTLPAVAKPEDPPKAQEPNPAAQGDPGK